MFKDGGLELWQEMKSNEEGKSKRLLAAQINIVSR